jgi:hypothetical protein
MTGGTVETMAMYVDGAWVPSESGATFDAVSPARASLRAPYDPTNAHIRA